MKDNVLAQFASKLPPARAPREAEPEPDVGLEDNLGAFGFLRGERDRAVMLELRRKDGGTVALGYSWLERVDFDPSHGITLTFAGHTVKIAGRNLTSELRPKVRLYSTDCAAIGSRGFRSPTNRRRGGQTVPPRS